MTPSPQPLALAATNADLTARLQALETVCLQLIAERDRAIMELGRAAQLTIGGERT